MSDSGGTVAPTTADNAARETALDPSRSFVVQAPAGSGKTELLVRRFLVLLARAARPESVMAMTFTRKAAGEMRERIASALSDAASGLEPDDGYLRQRWHLARAALERGREQGWGLLENPGRLQIYTIDSLCARLAGSLPLLSRFGSHPSTIEDAEPLFRQAVRRTLAAAGSSSEVGRDLTVILERFEMNVGGLEKQLISMLGRREQWTTAALEVRRGGGDVIELFEQHFAEIMNETLAVLAAGLPRAIARAACKAAALSRDELAKTGEVCAWPTLSSAEQLKPDIDAIPAWRELAELLLTSAGKLRKRVTKAHGAPRDSKANEVFVSLLADAHSAFNREACSFVDELAAMRRFPDSPHFSDDGRRALEAFFRVMLTCHGELWQVFRRRGEVDFIEVAVRAIAALGDASAPSDLLERLDHRVDHLLVDEFQDTNVLQCELIRRLTAAWSGGDGRTLFLVGDPMQSIYRFRKAEVGLFLRAASGTRLFANVETEPLRLEVNFRSDRSIIEWVNSRFSNAMGEDNHAGQGRVAYARSKARDDAGEGVSVETVGWRADTQQADTKLARAAAQAAEAEGLAARIADELLGEARERGGSVAVLVRNRGHAQALMTALRRRGVRYRAGGVDALDKRAVVQDLRSLARFIVHRGDRLAGLALLRSPLVGLSLQDLCLLVEHDVARVVAQRNEASARRSQHQPNGDGDEPEIGYACVSDLLASEQALDRVSEDGRVRLRRVRDVLSRARRLLGRVSLARIVESAFVELGGASTADDTEALDAQEFFGVLGACEHAAGIDCDELDRRLEGLTASGDPDPAVAVELMTMHGAKGLEFDTVVLPSLSSCSRSGANDLVAYETEPATGLMTITAPCPPRGRDDSDDTKFALLGRRERVRGIAENIRLFYVAVTRAKHRLLLSTPALKRDDKDELKPPADGSLLAALWPSLEPSYQEREVDVVGAGGATPVPTRIRSDFHLPAAPQPVADYLYLRRPSATVEDLDYGEDESARLALRKGTVVHHWLEEIGREGLTAWSHERLRGERPRIERALRSQGVCDEDIGVAGDEIVAALCRALCDERGRWLLSRHQDDRYEWKLRLYAGAHDGDGRSEVVVATIDRSFIDDDGVRWIVDYKTGQLPRQCSASEDGGGKAAPGAGGLDSFLEERRGHYQGQLHSYGELLHELEPGRPIMLALYFPEVEGGWCAWRFED